MSDNIDQAAILLLGMGEEYAAEVLKHLSHKQVETIVEVMNRLGDVSEQQVLTTLNNFLTKSATSTGLAINSQDFISKTLVSAIGKERAGPILERSMGENKVKGVDVLNWQQPRVIAEILQDEHPQVIAVVFTYLESEKAANALALLPKNLHVDVVKRLSNIGPISPTALDDLALVIEQQLSETPGFKELQTSGIDTAAQIVNFLDSDLENELMNGMSTVDQQLSQKLQDRMFPFEKLASVDNRSLQTLLRNIANDKLVLALKGSEQELKDAFLRNMSERAADMIKDDLESLGPVQLSKIEAAQKEIVSTAQRLAKEGQMILVNSGDVVM